MQTLPKTRTSSLVMQTVGDETLIYDLNNHRAYCLNSTASTVWNACDGKTNVESFMAASGMPRELVSYSIGRLREYDLLDEAGAVNTPPNTISRRNAIALAAKTAIALPVIGMLVAPPAARAQSTCLGSGGTFELLPTPFFPDAQACVDALQAEAEIVCCSGSLNPSFGFEFGTDPQLCRGHCL